MATLNVVNFYKKFGSFTAVKNLNLEVLNGEFMVLLGPSGCGKTTTLRTIAGLETATAGDILIDGERVNDYHARDRDIAFVFQMYALYPHISVYGNIAFPLEAQGFKKSEIKRRIDEVAALLKIGHLLDKKPRELSGGDMQKVAVGRAIVRRPKAFLMDEPIGTLDAKFREQMRTDLKRLHVDIGATTIYVTHDQVEAMSMGDKIAVMNQAVLQQVGTPAEVYESPNNLFVANFIGSPGMNFLEVSCERFNGSIKAALTKAGHVTVNIDPSIHRELSNKYMDGTIILGIRPERVKVSSHQENDYMRGSVYVTEPLGRYNIVDIKLDSNIFIKAKTDADMLFDSGDTVWLGFDQGSIHFFDKASGDVIRN